MNRLNEIMKSEINEWIDYVLSENRIINADYEEISKLIGEWAYRIGSGETKFIELKYFLQRILNSHENRIVLEKENYEIDLKILWYEFRKNTYMCIANIINNINIKANKEGLDLNNDNLIFIDNNFCKEEVRLVIKRLKVEV